MASGSPFAAPPDYQQGETVKIMYLHVPAAWMATFVYAVMAAASARHAGLAPPASGRGAEGRRAARRGIHFHLPCHRVAVGQADVGNLLGVGRAPDFSAGAVHSLSRLVALCRDDRRAGPAARADAIRTLVCTVNLPIIKFSSTVEDLHQPASVFGSAGRRSRCAALAFDRYVAGLTRLFLTLHLMAIRDEIMPAHRRVTTLAAAEGDRRKSNSPWRRMMADPYIGFVIAAYAVAAATIAAMIGAVVLDGRRLNAELDAAARALMRPVAACKDEKRDQRQRRGRPAPAPLAHVSAVGGFRRPRRLLFVRLNAGDPASIPSALIGQSAPRFDLLGLDGAAGLTDADLRSGHVSVVNIFASWCEPCHYEHEYLMALAADPALHAKGVAIYGVAQRESARTFAASSAPRATPTSRWVSTGMTAPASIGAFTAVPETFIVRGDGTLVFKLVGPMTAETLESEVKPEILKAMN